MSAAPDPDPGATDVRIVEAWMAGPAVAPVMAALGAGGVDVRFVGGCVRDALIGGPVGDLDIGVPLAPDEAVRRLEAAGLRAVPTGIGHGTVTAVSAGTGFEVTALRRDVETDGRHARVAFTADWGADAQRRDFTVNALSLRPDGAVFDYVGGLADLAARRIRFVGDPARRIAEDRLRILRFYRFAARFGMAGCDPAGRAACIAGAAEIGTLSRERIGQEFVRTILARHAADALDAMAADGILDAVAPFAWTPARFRRLAALEAALGLPADPCRRLAALTGDLDRAGAPGRALRLSRTQSERLSAIRRLAPAAAQALAGPAAGRVADRPAQERAARAAFYRHGAGAWRDAALYAAASREEADAEALRPLVEAAGAWRRPVLPVRGADLAARGVAGPAVGRALRAVERWWIASDFAPDRAAALKKLEEEAAPERAATETGPS